MKSSIVLYCKSFSRDLPRVKVLFESIVKHNKDGIGFIVSVPANDVLLFTVTLQDMFPQYDNWDVLSDQEIVGENLAESWKNQQVVKMMFWKHELCGKNYVVLDSDMYFIKNFYIKDFIVYDNNPYTICHQQHDLFNWTSKNISILGFDPSKSFGECRYPIMELFGRKGKLYDGGPVPCVWNKKIWQSLEEEYLNPNKLTYQNLIDTIPSEFTWYLEWMLTHPNIIPLYPSEPLFKVMHYMQQYQEFKNQGYTEEEWAKNYLGIVQQSSSGLPLKY